jgi:2-polyprenyl-3-methyl-5-hydroxy-6-metoxy-1,4-benzoquinol methylase
MKCRICDKETEPFLRLSTSGLDEPFLDATLRRQLPELRLRRCSRCACLWANDARQDHAILTDAYARVSATYFDSSEHDPRYLRFYKQLDQLASGHVSRKTILDVGCGDGAFLSSLSDTWSKHGIEPSESGSTLAQRRKLDVACATLDSSATRYEADLITALDVIEHVIDPHQFIESLKRYLLSHGIVLLLTGDAGSPPARIAGPQWSYLRWVGHISIFSRSGLQKLLELHGFEIIDWTRCEHPSSPGAVAWWRVHVLEPARRALGRNRSWYPFWRDHQTVVARLK